MWASSTALELPLCSSTGFATTRSAFLTVFLVTLVYAPLQLILSKRNDVILPNYGLFFSLFFILFTKTRLNMQL